MAGEASPTFEMAPGRARTVIHYCDSAVFGGTEQAMLHLLAGLDRQRWAPVLFHHPEPGIGPLLQGAHRLNIRTRAVPRMGGMGTLAAFPRFLGQVLSERPAVFHAHLSWLLSCKYGLLAASLARVPAVIATAQQYMQPPWGRTVYLQQQVVAAGVHRYIAVSEAVARQLRDTFRLPAGKVNLVHNSVPFGQFATSPGRSPDVRVNGESRGPVVLTVARLDKQKGHRYLLEAAAFVPGAFFVLAGDGPERVTLEEQARRLRLDGRVKFLGHRHDIAELLSACDLFVLPSLYEGLPLSILEAMASGKPVVATAVSGNPEAVLNGETGLLVPPGDPTSLAKAINSLLADPDLARQLGVSGAERARREFSAATMVQRVSTIYEEVLAFSYLQKVCHPDGLVEQDQRTKPKSLGD